MNEFFRCPSYTYGILVIFILTYTIIYVYAQTLPSDPQSQDIFMSDGAGLSLSLAGSILVGVWLLWTTWNWLFRHADCNRVGQFTGDFRNPFA
jgi:hypothetical protein